MIPISAPRAGLVSGILAACFTLALFFVREVPDAALAYVGGPQGGVARYGGARIKFVPPPGVALEDISENLDNADVRREGSSLWIELPGIGRDQLAMVEDMLVEGGLQFRESIDRGYATEIARADPTVIREPIPEDYDTGVTLEPDWWANEDGSQRTTAFLRAKDAKVLLATLGRASANGWRPAPNTEILLEHVVPDRPEQKPYVRTHQLAKGAALDGSGIASAVGAFEPDSGRPVVLVDLTTDAAGTFCDLTMKMRGEKLAIVLGDRVHSAPIVNSAICNGRISIWMGGSNPDIQLAERDALVAVLQVGWVPSGGAIDESRWHSPPDDISRFEWIARGVLAGLAGLLFALLTVLVVKLAHPHRSERVAVKGRAPVRRIVVTLLTPIVLFVLDVVPLPGADEINLIPDELNVNLRELGLISVIAAFIVVELLAIVVPPLGRMRGDPRGRVRLGQLAAILAIAFAFIHGFVVARMLASSDRLLVDGDLGTRMLLAGTLACGTLVMVWLAGMIREHGLGNGYGIVIVTSWLLDLVPRFLDESLGYVPLDLAAMAAIAIWVARFTRWRTGEPGLRAPTSSMVPVLVAPAIAMMLAWAPHVNDVVMELAARILRISPLTWIAVALALVPICAWLFARPGLIASAAARAGLAAPTSWWRSLAVSLLAVAPVLAVMTLLQRPERGMFDPFVALIPGVVLLDAIADARARREPLETAWVLHQVQLAGPIEHALRQAKIRAHFHASHFRQVFAFFAPFAPITVLVPVDQAAEARMVIAGIVESRDISR